MGAKGSKVKEPPISPDDFELMTVLGLGSFGKVYQARYKPLGTIVALKVLKVGDIIAEDQVEHVLLERNIMAKLHHPFLLGMKCAFRTNSRLFMMLEYMKGGDLYYQLRTNNLFSEEFVKFYLAELVLAIDYLHSIGIVHRDLKLENILLDKEGHIRLTDFGLAHRASRGERSVMSFSGTPMYLAPEIIGGKGHTTTVDFWSLGVLVYLMLSGKPPFFSSNKKTMFDMIMNNELDLPKNISENAKQLLAGLLTRDPAERLGCGEGGIDRLKQHPFFEGMDWELLLEKKVTPPIIPEQSEDDKAVNVDKEFSTVKISPREALGEKKKLSKHFASWPYVSPEMESVFSSMEEKQ